MNKNIKIDDITNLTGMKDLLNVEEIDPLQASKVERDILDTGQPKPTSMEYHHSEFKQNIDDQFKQLEFDQSMDSSIGTHDKPENNTNNDSNNLINLLSSSDETDNSPDLISSILNPKDVHDPYLQKITNEQNTQRLVGDMLDNDDQDDYINKIEETDEKLKLLEKIDMLREILTAEQIEINHIKPVDRFSNLDEIQSTLKILDRKNNRTRHTNFAEDCILGLVYIAEDICDGKKEYFGRKPDLTGWHKTVNTKLMRMRYDTTEVAEGITEGMGLGPGARIALELLPSMFTYSRQRRTQHNSHAISDEEVDKAINDVASTS